MEKKVRTSSEHLPIYLSHIKLRIIFSKSNAKSRFFKQNSLNDPDKANSENKFQLSKVLGLAVRLVG